MNIATHNSNQASFLGRTNLLPTTRENPTPLLPTCCCGQTDSLNLSGYGMMMMRMMSMMMQVFAQMQGPHLAPGAPYSPLQQFLGSQSPGFGAGASSRAQGQQGLDPAWGLQTQGAGRGIQDVNLSRLIQALPPSRRRSAQRHFPVIIQEAQRRGVTNKAQLAYILATATHESGAGAFMEEFASGRAYEGRRDLGNNQRGDGRRFKGRGYVQLTGRRNYQDWSSRLGIDLVSNPGRVEEPAIAARILVDGMMRGTFTGRGLDSYINDNQTDFRNARRVINGTDRAGQIGNIAQRLQLALG